MTETVFVMQLRLKALTLLLNLEHSFRKIKDLRFSSTNILDLSCLHLDYIRNIVGSPQGIIVGTVNILINAETKTDVCVTTAQITAKGYHEPYRLDVSEKNGCILDSVNSSVPSRYLNCGKQFLIKQNKFEEGKVASNINLQTVKIMNIFYMNWTN